MSHAISWYASISSMHTGVDVIAPESDLSRYKLVFAPVQYVLSEKQAARIRSYVEGGGTFVTSFRLGVKDESSQIVRTPLPGLLRDVMGVTVKDYVPIYSEKIGVKFSGPLAGPDGTCALWADRLDRVVERDRARDLHCAIRRRRGDHDEHVRQRQSRLHRRRSRPDESRPRARHARCDFRAANPRSKFLAASNSQRENPARHSGLMS